MTKLDSAQEPRAKTVVARMRLPSEAIDGNARSSAILLPTTFYPGTSSWLYQRDVSPVFKLVVAPWTV